MTTNTRRACVVSVDTRDDIVIAALDDGKVNVLGFDMIAQLREALVIAVDHRVPLVIAGRDDVLSAGFDLAVVAEGGAGLVRLLDDAKELYLELLEAPVPVVVACTGHSIAAGALLLLCADHRIGAPGAYTIGLKEVRLGMALPAFALTLAAARLDRHHLIAATIFADAGDPHRAVRHGYLDDLADDPVSAAVSFARELSKLPSGPLGVTRRIAHRPLIETLRGQDLYPPTEDVA
ncbi:crotonase/enoyl-CoA hydratase family protein [Aeromicrobium panaciterrae]|uniref:crotonase/enoyl-CoA hydratase family protein n=1 Tax=Aeromicrobium panaciterrae TaxID=363861 RepID=UPI0031E2B8F0